jgi:hypothetical protein
MSRDSPLGLRAPQQEPQPPVVLIMQQAPVALARVPISRHCGEPGWVSSPGRS